MAGQGACKQLVGLVMDYVIMNWETNRRNDLGRILISLIDFCPPSVHPLLVISRLALGIPDVVFGRAARP